MAPHRDPARPSITCLVLSHADSVLMLIFQVIPSDQCKEKVRLFSPIFLSLFPFPSL